MLGDERVPEAERERIWLLFLDAHPCCLPPGFARKFQAEANSAPAGRSWFRDPWWVSFWRNFASIFTLQTADVEFRHARNNHRRKFGFGGAQQLVSRYIVSEAQTLHAGHVKSFDFLHNSINSVAVAVAPHDNRDQFAHWLRLPTIYELFKFDFMRRQQIVNGTANPASQLFHVEAERAFEE